MRLKVAPLLLPCPHELMALELLARPRQQSALELLAWPPRYELLAQAHMLLLHTQPHPIISGSAASAAAIPALALPPAVPTPCAVAGLSASGQVRWAKSCCFGPVNSRHTLPAPHAFTPLVCRAGVGNAQVSLPHQKTCQTSQCIWGNSCVHSWGGLRGYPTLLGGEP